MAGWFTALVTVLIALDAAAGALPALPDLARPARLAAWVDQVGAVPAAFALLRVLALVMTWYLLATTVLGAAARIARSASLTRLADAATLPQLRRFLHHAVGAGTLAVALPLGAGLAPATSALAPPVAVAQPAPVVLPPDASPPTIRGIATAEALSPAASTPTASAAPPGPTDPPVVRAHQDPATRPAPASVAPEGSAPILPPADAAGPSDAASSAPAPGAAPDSDAREDTDTSPPRVAPEPPASPSVPSGPGAEASESPASDASPPDGTWRIEPGDHLWRVAESTLERHWARPPTGAETTAYLDQLVEANRASLVVPDNPDLVFAGQVFVLPAVRISTHPARQPGTPARTDRPYVA